MPEKFDPYYRWLGVPPKEQPPNHYRLLGIELFEPDPQLIDSFALRHTDFLREITDGPHLPDAQRLLNELAAARRCLLDPQRKAAYDAELRERLIPVGKPLANTDAVVPRPEPAAATRSAPPSGEIPAITVAGRKESQPASDKTPSRRPKPSRPPIWLLAGSLAVTLVVISFTAAVVMRSRPKPNRPATTIAAIPQATNRLVTTNVPATLPKQTAAPEPPSNLVDDEPPEAAKVKRPDGESTAAVATITPPEIAAAPGVFIPAGQAPRLPGLVLWLDASSLTPAAGRIAHWNDAGGGNYVAQPKQKSQQPEVLAQALQGKAVARFRGAQWLEISGTSQTLNLGSDYTIAYVARGVAGTLLSKGTGGKAGQFSLQSDSCFLTNGEVNLQSNGRLTAAEDDPGRFRVRTIAADTTGLNWFIDGTAGGSYPGDRHEIQNTTVLRIGSPAFRSGKEDVSQFFVGDLAELLIYGRALPEDERRRVEAYLQEKWLSGDTPPAPLDLVAPPTVSPTAENTADKKEETPIPGQRLSLRDQPVPPHEIGFVALTPVRAEASAGSQLRILDEGTVLADGAATENEVYTLTFELSMPTITAVQLQAVPHESLPGGGPGLGLGGSFRLAEVQVGAAPAGSDAVPQTAKFREVLTSDGDKGVARLIDGNPETVWRCRRGGQPVSLTFLPSEPIRMSGPLVLHVTLHNRENLGCFRLLATSMPEPTKPAPSDSRQAAPARSDLFSLFVNLGGDPWQDPAGNLWVASKDFDGTTFGHEAGQMVKSDAVENPVYSTAVRKLTAFRAVVPNGEYSVELHFQEHWSKKPADRAFAVMIEQQPVLRPPLFFQGPGMGQPYVHAIPRITVKDGRLDVDFSPTLPGSLTILNGIVIRQLR